LVSPPARSGYILLQDEILGVEARTPQQQHYAKEIHVLMTRQQPVSTSAKPVTYYLDTHLTQTLSATYGSRLEGMYKLSKLVFRGALSLYAVWSQWPNSNSAQSLMLQAIDSVDSTIQTDDEDVFQAILACAELPAPSLENLILSLTEQIHDTCWSEDPASQSGPISDPFDVVVSVTKSPDSL
jgi:hypothetical protein